MLQLDRKSKNKQRDQGNKHLTQYKVRSSLQSFRELIDSDRRAISKDTACNQSRKKRTVIRYPFGKCQKPVRGQSRAGTHLSMAKLHQPLSNQTAYAVSNQSRGEVGKANTDQE